ncbi:MAG: hypothetical protein C4547_07410 [Phycisphaerales bacterium]|nr:MAG: hypothetical protein C4547_07410 [Phycisphaerales bacterium]
MRWERSPLPIIRIGSTGNGHNTLVVSGGPLINEGTLDAADARSQAKYIQAELDNRGDLTNGTPGAMRLTMPGVEHLNSGEILLSRGGLVVAAGSTLVNVEGGVITCTGSATFSATGLMPNGLWFTNRGLVKVATPDVVLTITNPSGRHIQNDPTGIFRAAAGALVINNGGTLHNDGPWTVEPDARFLILQNFPDNYDENERRWTSGRLTVHGPGEFCLPLPNTMLTLGAKLHCISEVAVCTQGGMPDPFKDLERIEETGHFILDDMDMPTAGDFQNDNVLELVNGATMTVPGRFRQTAGRTNLDQGKLAADVIEIDSGEVTGDGEVEGDVLNHAGQIEPGGAGVPGRCRFAQGYTHGQAARLSIDIGGLTPESEHDVMDVAGDAALDGSLELLLIDEFEPQVGDTFAVLTFGARSGEFERVSMPCGYEFAVHYNANDVTLEVTGVGVPYPGDFDGDCDIDLDDYRRVAACLAGPGVEDPPKECGPDDFAAADLDADRDVDLSDVDDFINRFTGP